MIKAIIKEIIITILLCVAIVLILGVVFYNYNPVNKIVPSKVEKYATAESLKEEISVNVLTLETTNVLYKIEATDLNMYIKNKSYVQGKANPFEEKSASAGNTAGNNNSGSSGGGSSSSGGTSSTGTENTSDGTFWNSTKIK